MTARESTDVFAPDAEHIQVVNILWPRGWEALKLGFHFTAGCILAVCVWWWFTQAIRWFGAMTGPWA